MIHEFSKLVDQQVHDQLSDNALDALEKLILPYEEQGACMDCVAYWHMIYMADVFLEQNGLAPTLALIKQVQEYVTDHAQAINANNKNRD